MRPLLLALVVSGLSGAPIQCASEPEPDQRRYETPGEALYGLSTRFKREGNEAAWRSTLEYLVARYPNSRFAVRARAELREGAAPAPSGSAP